MGDLLWPTYDGPGDLAAIEAVPLADRGLPGTTYELLVRAAGLWPDRVALSVLPDGDRWEQPAERTFAELLADVHRYANVFHALGVRRTDGVALLAPNCDELDHRDPGGRARRHRRADQQWPVRGAHRRAAAQVGRTRPRGRRSRPRTRGLGRRARRSPSRPGSRPCSPYARPEASAARRSCSRSTACGSATCPRWRRSSHTTASWVSRPRPPTSPLSSTPVVRRARRSSQRTPTPTRSADAWMIAAIGVLDTESVVVRRAAALPRQRPGRHPARAAVQGAAGGVGGTPRIPRHHAVRQLLEGGRAVPHQLHERRTDDLCGPRRPPRRRRHQQPAIRPRRRVPPAEGRPREVRVSDRGAPHGGLRPDRGDLRQRPQLRGPPGPRIRRPAAALPAGEDHRGQCRR